ncbi:hypothetical protein [Streptomyces mirabilis]|uniref:hypothetical protein n=1 Tax=Streptomyces mirabilis TaxID=68239 RepID=UPI0037115403
MADGSGVVHNALLLRHPERTVVYGALRLAPRSLPTGEFSLTPKPPWFVTNRTAATTGRRLTAFAARPRCAALPAIFASARRGWPIPTAATCRNPRMRQAGPSAAAPQDRHRSSIRSTQRK